jgi:sterol desaturase/sphingolipid hydroxylase (fatty acid hydroxylase superfamily)
MAFAQVEPAGMAESWRSWLPGAALAGIIGALLIMERRRPLRRRADPGARRLARNLAVSGLTAAVLAVAERPLVQRLSARAERERWGLLPRLGLPRWASIAAAVVLLDYTLYLWHILLHRSRILWRFHLAHHIDLDLDVSTALRFHFGEFLASIPWRLGQIALIGVGPRTLSLWQKLTLAEVAFHHANLRLPPAFERRLSRFVMTPRLHGIHHSSEAAERDSNFSSGFTVWDVLHGTLRTGTPQAEITIGVPPYDAPGEVTLGRTLAVPFLSDPGRAAR